MQKYYKNDNRVKKKLWSQPWAYTESFLINLVLLAGGFAFEYFFPAYRITLPGWPFNLVIILGLIVLFWFSNKYLNHKLKGFFSSIPAAITSIGFFMLLVLLMGFIPQGKQNGWIQALGLTHIKNSWPYLLTTLYLLAILGHTIFSRLTKFNLKNTAFFLNHAGLWILIAAASLGAADLQRLTMKLILNRPVYMADDENGIPRKLSFAIELLNFDIEEYPPSLGIIETKTSKLVLTKGDELFEVKQGNTFDWNEWHFEILSYIPQAKFKNGHFEETGTMGAPPACEVKIVNTNKKIEETAWVSAGNFLYRANLFPLDENLSLAMTIPRPRQFSSKIRILNTTGNYNDYEIIVNKPIEAQGYKIYQVGYDERLGKWSRVSIIELVRDPWLPAVYIGIFMVLAGSVYLAWAGKSKLK